MITKQHRFHGYNKLQAVYRKGQTARSGALSLKYHPNKRKDYRLAVVVSRKVSKSAVTRNRIRRRIYEAFRKNEHLFGPYDMIVTVFSDTIATCPADQLDDTIKNIVSRAGITNNS